jgi:hypothetical protein
LGLGIFSGGAAAAAGLKGLATAVGPPPSTLEAEVEVVNSFSVGDDTLCVYCSVVVVTEATGRGWTAAGTGAGAGPGAGGATMVAGGTGDLERAWMGVGGMTRALGGDFTGELGAGGGGGGGARGCCCCCTSLRGALIGVGTMEGAPPRCS